MAFTILYNSTPADASDVNNNFYAVAQGSRLPMGGTSLDPTDSVYDLGASTATWNNLFCENIYINGSITTANKSLWTLVSEVTLTATASSIEFTGLNGDANQEYKIIYYTTINVGAGNVGILFNQDSAANYGWQVIVGQSTAVSASRQTAYNMLSICDANINGSFGVLQMNVETGLTRMVLGNYLWKSTNTATFIYIVGNLCGVWNNTVDTITSIKFIAADGAGAFNPNTYIELWERG